MPTLVIVRNPGDWPIHIPGVEVVSSREYLMNPHYARLRHVKAFNLCRSYGYQSNGYYVSLLAAARGHRPLPDISTLQDIRSTSIRRVITEDLDRLIQARLKDIHSASFELSIYFGRNMAHKYDSLSQMLFNMFPAPLLRAYFVFKKDWELRRIIPISASEIPESHRAFVIEQARIYFRKKKAPAKRTAASFDLAILYNPKEKHAPSNRRALARFRKAAQAVGMRPEFITRDDYGRIAEFDGLFIRTTTQVNHYTYQFARRAEAEGLAVIDDPESIIRCTNKVFLTEALKKRHIPIPRTFILNREQLEEAARRMPLPCVLKMPDSAFSKGVLKVHDRESFFKEARRFLEESDLIVAQEFIPTDFDWRIGVLDNRPLYACKYHMVRDHWQILKKASSGRLIAGKVETLPLRQVPDEVLRVAVESSRTIGKGFYGVDIKQTDKRIVVIEVNDNPSIDAGYEDRLMQDKLYLKIMRSLRKRIERLKEGRSL